MASSSETQVSPPSHLISKVLHSGDSVRIGRKPFCEIMVKSRFISGIHCRIDVTESQSSLQANDGLHFFISDLSTNGTWVLKDVSRSLQGANNSAKLQPGNEYNLAKKLPVKTKEVLRPGDCILLLAPGHKECARYRFVMKMNGSECILEQLPVASNGSKKTDEGSEENASLAAVVGSLTSAGDRSTSWSDSPKGSSKKHSSISVSSGGKTEGSFSSALSESSLKEKQESFVMGRNSLETSPRDLGEVEMERCPNCWKLFPVYELPLHSPICQESALKRKRSSHSREEEEEAILTSSPSESRKTSPPTDFVEQCPHCLDLFPLDVLISHAETCSLASSTGSSRGSRGSSSGAESAKIKHTTEGASIDRAAAPPVPMLMDMSQEQCPYCSVLFPIAELITHCASCCKSSTSEMPTSKEEIHSTAADLSDVETDPGVVAKRARYTLEPFERSTATFLPSSSTGHAGSSLAAMREDETLGKPRSSVDDGVVDLEQCVHCLKEFPISELVSHAGSCAAAGKEPAAENCVLEHCQHCLNVFPLSELVEHALNCSQRKDIGSMDTEDGFVGDEELWGEPLERCMHCFKDFPLSKIIEHSRKCKGDMLGSRERFKNFLPSVHDLDAMSLAVLKENQMRAVEHVMEVSKKESESVYTQLRDRVVGLGYTERDLEKTLQWIRRDAPIIIHIHLDRVLHFLVKDTHYRNMFETHTGSGSLDRSARSVWEDRIFNNLYRGSAAEDRVKYGVLNIVGDPRGVRSCSGYGDSFLQLKKVRLRTTFASEDTSSSGVVLSCCEHYGNVLYRYNNSELKAILEVATRKVEFLRSDMISQYKEIQIHGPVCLSENVDCIVVNDRHSADTAMRELLDEFVTKNKCNLIWMERDDRIDYPSFTRTTTHFPSFIPPPPIYSSAPPAVLSPALPHARRRRKRRRRERRSEDWH